MKKYQVDVIEYVPVKYSYMVEAQSRFEAGVKVKRAIDGEYDEQSDEGKEAEAILESREYVDQMARDCIEAVSEVDDFPHWRIREETESVDDAIHIVDLLGERKEGLTEALDEMDFKDKIIKVSDVLTRLNPDNNADINSLFYDYLSDNGLNVCCECSLIGDSLADLRWISYDFEWLGDTERETAPDCLCDQCFETLKNDGSLKPL